MTPRRHSASGWARPALTRATLLTVLLGLTVALAGVLAYEAHQASRSQRVTAERALRDYASFAAHDFVAGAAASLDSIITGALRPAVSVRATSPYEPLGDPAVLLRAARRALPCAVPDDDGPAFAVDLGSRAVRVAGADAPRTAMAWLRDTIIVHARGSYRPGWRYAVILGQGAMRGRAAVYGVRYAEHDVPVAAYGWLTCAPAAVAPLVRAAAAGHVALPAAASAVRGDSLLALEIRDAVGATLYRSPAAAALDSSPLDPSPLAAAVTLEQLGGVTVRVALRPEAARGLVMEWPPRSRVPLLLGVLALTAGLAAIAAIQLRREHELTRLRADFTSSVSHELRTPLAQILLYAETLSLERVRSATERREAAETIVQEARRLMHMVDNVLHFARAERGGNRVIARAMPLAPVVRAVLTTFAPLAEGSGVRLRAALDEALAARVDAAALRQILLNLLDNAVKYGPAGQTVTVGSARLDGYVRLWVEDEGAGIPVPDRERIWHPFVRIARDQHAARAGSGIGLAVVRELVELHGGRAWVESGVGGGARFVVEVGEDSESVAELESQPASESGSEPVSGERREGTGEEAHEPARGATRGPPPDITMVPDAPHAGIEAVPAGAIRRRVPPGGGR